MLKVGDLVRCIAPVTYEFGEYFPATHESMRLLIVGHVYEILDINYNYQEYKIYIPKVSNNSLSGEKWWFSIFKFERFEPPRLPPPYLSMDELEHAQRLLMELKS